jgi:hypothetical protein
MWNLTNCDIKNGTFSILDLINNKDVDVILGVYCSIGEFISFLTTDNIFQTILLLLNFAFAIYILNLSNSFLIS